MVILTSVGATSRKVRKNPVVRIVDGEGYMAVASAGGSPANPSRYANLVTRVDAWQAVATSRSSCWSPSRHARQSPRLSGTATTLSPAKEARP